MYKQTSIRLTKKQEQNLKDKSLEYSLSQAEILRLMIDNYATNDNIKKIKKDINRLMFSLELKHTLLAKTKLKKQLKPK